MKNKFEGLLSGVEAGDVLEVECEVREGYGLDDDIRASVLVSVDKVQLSTQL